MRAEWHVSIRRACAALKAERSSYHYKVMRSDQSAFKGCTKEIAETRCATAIGGSRLLKREGWPVNGKRIYRLYKELRLQLRNKTPKRKVKAKPRDDRRPASGPNDLWAMDFLHDQLFDGRKIRIPDEFDTYSRFSSALDPRFAQKAADAVETLERPRKQVGYPRTIRVDNGPEFVAKDLDLWAFQLNVTLDFSRPGKPTDSAFAESFNVKVRAECLNTGSWPSTTPAQNAKLCVETITKSVPIARSAIIAQSSY